jgi:hypothetical protein
VHPRLTFLKVHVRRGKVVGRWLCCNRPYDDTDGRRLHQCTTASFLAILWRRSTAKAGCRSCSTSHDAEDGGPPCCTSPVCYYCFRGAHVLVCLDVTPLFGFVVPRLFERLLLMLKRPTTTLCCLPRRSQYNSLPMTTIMAPTMAEELLEMEEDQPAPVEDYGSALCRDPCPTEQHRRTSFSSSSSSSSSHIRYTYIYRSSSVDDSLATALCEQVGGGPDAAATAVVVCGSDALVDAVQDAVQRQDHHANTRVFVVR